MVFRMLDRNHKYEKNVVKKYRSDLVLAINVYIPDVNLY